MQKSKSITPLYGFLLNKNPICRSCAEKIIPIDNNFLSSVAVKIVEDNFAGIAPFVIFVTVKPRPICNG